MNKKLPLAALAALLLPAAPSGLRAEPLPPSTFFRPFAYEGVSISPDGKRLGIISTIGEESAHRVLIILDLATNKTNLIQAPAMPSGWGDDGINEVRDFRWLTSDRVAFDYQRPDGRQFGIGTVNCDGTGWTDFPEMSGIAFADAHSDRFFILGSAWGATADHPLVYEVNASPARTAYSDESRASAVTQNRHVVADDSEGVNDWVFDRRGEVRVGEAFDGENTSVIYRDNDDAPWVRLGDFGPHGLSGFPRSIDWDGRTAYVPTLTSYGTWGMSTYDLVARKSGPLIAADPNYDILTPNDFMFTRTSLFFSQKKQKLIGIQYQAAVPRVIWFDPEMAQIQASIDHAIPGMTNSIYDWSDDEERLLIESTSDRNPGTYYLFDKVAHRMRKLFDAAPWINPPAMGRTMPLSFRAGDGLIVHGYVTLPPGKAAVNLPMVVMPSSGLIFGRVTWGFNPIAQFFANRGYAVLTVNPRGSPGYGAKFYEAGKKEAGTGMQDDITDAVRWAIGRKVADPKRIAIVGGGGYGGFSAEWGLTRASDLYRCGVSIEGICDWPAYLKVFDDGPSFIKEIGYGRNSELLNYLAREVGDTKSDGAMLQDMSPVNHIDRIKAPVLLIRYKIEGYDPSDQSVEFADALKRVGARCQLKIYPKIKDNSDIQRDLEQSYSLIADFLSANMN